MTQQILQFVGCRRSSVYLKNKLLSSIFHDWEDETCYIPHINHISKESYILKVKSSTEPFFSLCLSHLVKLLLLKKEMEG